MKRPLPLSIPSPEVQAILTLLDDATPWPMCPCGMETQFSWLNVGPLTDADMQELLHSDPQKFCDNLVLPPVFICNECERETQIDVPWPKTWQSPLVHPTPVVQAGPYPLKSPTVFKFCPHCGERLSTD